MNWPGNFAGSGGDGHTDHGHGGGAAPAAGSVDDHAAQMLAIAIVVATMDWASSRLRERFV